MWSISTSSWFLQPLVWCLCRLRSSGQFDFSGRRLRELFPSSVPCQVRQFIQRLRQSWRPLQNFPFVFEEMNWTSDPEFDTHRLGSTIVFSQGDDFRKIISVSHVCLVRPCYNLMRQFAEAVGFSHVSFVKVDSEDTDCASFSVDPS